MADNSPIEESKPEAEATYKRRVDPNLLIALGVLIASFSALFVYIQQASIMREQTELLLEQTKANAWPHLTISMIVGGSLNELAHYEITISNRGTGPAIIEGTVITYQGKPAQNWEQLYSILEVPDSIDITYGYHNLYGSVIRPGKDLSLVDWSSNEALMQYIYKQADEITIQICYRSVYNDFWHVERKGFYNDLEQNIRREIKRCVLSSDSLFLQ